MNWKKSRRSQAKLLRFLCLFVALLIITLSFDKYSSIRHLNDEISSVPVPFWLDNRTYQNGRNIPSPIQTIDQVNLSNLTLIITACCRNVRSHLIGFQKNIRAVGQLFHHYRLYLGESDSKDGTLAFIQQWSREDPDHVRIFTEGQQRWHLFFRTQRIAHCRNTLLQNARTDLPGFDYYLAIDVDAASSVTFSLPGFLSNFIYPKSSWAAMTASQTQYYYDIWALRSAPTIGFDYRERARQLSYFSIGWSAVFPQIAAIHNRGIPASHPLIEVESAFGGAAIYSARYITDDCVYNGWKDHGFWFYREQCEHVPFNRCIRRNAGEGKIFINPRFHTI